MDAVNLADLYQLPPLEWATITDRLEEPIPQAPGSGGPNRHTFWLSTINTDGSPHVTGLGMLYVDGSFWFETGEGTRKARNLVRDPRCTLSISTVEFDLVVEGEARRVTDRPRIADLATRWEVGGWPVRVDDSGIALTAEFSAPSAGPPPWFVYELVPHSATALQTVAPGGAMRWRFSEDLAGHATGPVIGPVSRR